MAGLVISGFPGVGKSWVVQLVKDVRRVTATDSDSSLFHWVDSTAKDKIEHPDWPRNYMEHIREAMMAHDFVMVSTHDDVRKALVAAGIHFTLVYPSQEMKQEYIGRYIARGNAPGFVKLLWENYEKWIAELEAQPNCDRIVLKQGQYLSDVI